MHMHDFYVPAGAGRLVIFPEVAAHAGCRARRQVGQKLRPRRVRLDSTDQSRTGSAIQLRVG